MRRYAELCRAIGEAQPFAPARRAAFDIGSGTTKMLIADVVDGRLVETRRSEERSVAFALEFKKTPDKTLPKAIMDEGVAARSPRPPARRVSPTLSHSGDCRTRDAREGRGRHGVRGGRDGGL